MKCILVYMIMQIVSDGKDTKCGTSTAYELMNF